MKDQTGREIVSPLDMTREEIDGAARTVGAVVRQARRARLVAKYYPRPQTYQEWAHSAMCFTASRDDRSEFSKIRELIREGKLPNVADHAPRPHASGGAPRESALLGGAGAPTGDADGIRHTERALLRPLSNEGQRHE